MASAEPKHKGVGVAAVVKGIKANPRARARVPAHLAAYMHEPILATAWYPERDYDALIVLLASSIDPKHVGGDVWAYFGRTAAQRDVGGAQHEVPEKSRVENAGIYRNFRNVAGYDVAGVFLRVAKMWSLYHDTGRISYMRHRNERDVVVLRLQDFGFAVPGMANLQTAYMVEYARILGFSMKEHGALPSARGCEWHYELASHPELQASMARLPPWQPNGDPV